SGLEREAARQVVVDAPRRPEAYSDGGIGAEGLGREGGGDTHWTFSSSASRIASATSRMDLRLFMLSRWMRLKASLSLSLYFSIRTPLAFSTTLRVASASSRSFTFVSMARNSLKRLSAISIAG